MCTLARVLRVDPIGSCAVPRGGPPLDYVPHCELSAESPPYSLSCLDFSAEATPGYFAYCHLSGAPAGYVLFDVISRGVLRLNKLCIVICRGTFRLLMFVIAISRGHLC